MQLADYLTHSTLHTLPYNLLIYLGLIILGLRAVIICYELVGVAHDDLRRELRVRKKSNVH